MLRMYRRIPFSKTIIAEIIEDISSFFSNTVKNVNGTYPAPGFMGVFRNGLFAEYDQAGTFTFTVPNNITKMRLRTMGRGGMGYMASVNMGGPGGGFAHGIFTVTPGEILTITIPSYRNNAFTETSIVSNLNGLLIRATNGSSTSQVGGVGYGGDYQSTGGISPLTSGNGHGSGAPGSQMALKGGNGGNNAGGGVVGDVITSIGGTAGGGSIEGLTLPSGFPRFKTDGFWGIGHALTPGTGGNDTHYPGVCGGVGYGSTKWPTVVYGAGGSYPMKALTQYDLLGLAILEW